MGLKPTAYIDHFGPDFTYSKQQIDKSLKMAYASPSKNAVERKKEQWQLQSFLCYTETQKMNGKQSKTVARSLLIIHHSWYAGKKKYKRDM